MISAALVPTSVPNSGLQVDLVHLVAVQVDQLIDPELTHDLFRVGLAILDIDLYFLVARGEGNEAFQVVLGFPCIPAGGGGFRVDRQDVVYRLAEVFELGQLIFGGRVFKDAVNDFFGRKSFFSLLAHL